jgi:ADP-ribose pyrophosphatase YjhB (NUDIX family)
MITFARGNTQFAHRTVGVAVHDGHVLLHRAEVDDFWSLPGGRCELMEPAREALRREMREELGVDVRVERLLWVVENFFQLDGVDHHELGLYFLIDLGSDFRYDVRRSMLGAEGGLRLIFCWFPVDRLPHLRLYPTFLREALSALPETTEHVVHTDTE